MMPDLENLLANISAGNMEKEGGWRPIETAPKDGRHVWLGKPGSMRLGFWATGEQFENFGTVGGGFIDLARAEGTGPRGLTFAPTHWQPLPKPPVAKIPASEWMKQPSVGY